MFGFIHCDKQTATQNVVKERKGSLLAQNCASPSPEKETLFRETVQLPFTSETTRYLFNCHQLAEQEKKNKT